VRYITSVQGTLPTASTTFQTPSNAFSEEQLLGALLTWVLWEAH